MFARVCAALVGLALVAVPAWATPAQPPKDSTQKGAGSQEPAGNRSQKETPKGVEAKVVKVDAAKMTATVQLAGGKRQDLKITDKTKFVGPRGGVSDQGIKDDRFVAGAEIHIVMDATGRNVAEIHLPARKSDKPDKDK